jgi:hypothetical protein
MEKRIGANPSAANRGKEDFDPHRMLMTDSALPIHWRFASGQAFAGLRGMVRSFDFLRLADGHTYVGAKPAYLIDVIDGFLGEPEDVVFGGDRAELQRLRQMLVEQIQPAHEDGLAAGRRRWQEGNRVYGGLRIEELHDLALRSAPDDQVLRGWFAEGFCFA